jgi:hypothetical protein
MSRRATRSLIVATMLCMLPVRVFAADVAIISSSDIIPYNTCIDGIKEALSALSLQTTVLPEDPEDALETVKEIKDKNPRLMIAVGPQAAFAMAKEKGSPKRLFCMILIPRREPEYFAGPPDAEDTGHIAGPHAHRCLVHPRGESVHC